MLVPIKHENMVARRWPVVTLTLIAINTIVFFLTTMSMHDEAPQLGEVKADILILAALHPELKMHPEEQVLVDGFKQSHPAAWKQVQNPHRDVISPYDAKIKMMEDPEKLQQEMDSLNEQYAKLSSSSITEQYAFVPAHPTAVSYLTANFLHGGWMHLIGNMLFLYLFGDNVEDVLGPLGFLLLYLVGGFAGNLLFVSSNPATLIPSVGASGCIAAVAGAYAVMFARQPCSVRLMILVFPVAKFHMRAIWMLLLWFGTDVAQTLASRGHMDHAGVNFVVHGVGFAFGIAVAGFARVRGVMRRYETMPAGHLLFGYWPSDIEKAFLREQRILAARARAQMVGRVDQGFNRGSRDGFL